MEKQILIDKIHEKREDSFWYKGLGDIAKLSKGDREIIILNCGLIKVQFLNEDFYRKNQQAVDVALNLNLFDEDLESLNFSESNWFDFAYKKINSEEYEEIEGDERFTYSEAIESAKSYLEDDEFWKQL